MKANRRELFKTERRELWCLLVALAFLCTVSWGCVLKAVTAKAPPCQMMQPYCPDWLVPISITCGAPDGLDRTRDDADTAQH